MALITPIVVHRLPEGAGPTGEEVLELQNSFNIANVLPFLKALSVGFRSARHVSIDAKSTSVRRPRTISRP